MTFEVETASLKSTVSSMDSELQQMTRIANRLYEALIALDGSWEGPAHDVFEAEYAKDQRALSGIRNEIIGVIHGLREARERYDKCEDSVSADIKKIAI